MGPDQLLRDLRAAAGLSQREAGEVLGLPASSVAKRDRGEVDLGCAELLRILGRLPNHVLIADAHDGFRLLARSGTSGAGPPVAPPLAREPIPGSSPVLQPGDALDFLLERFSARVWISADAHLRGAADAVVPVPDAAMEPLYPQGSFVAVVLGSEPEPGQVGFCEAVDETGTVRHWVRLWHTQDADGVVLLASNPAWRPLHVALKDLRAVGRVVAWFGVGERALR